MGFKKNRSIENNATIVGPSLAVYDEPRLKRFLDFAQANDVVPNVLTWHEMVHPEDIPGHVEAMRSELRTRGLVLDGIAINEAVGPEQQYLPGAAVIYFANLERAGMLGSCKACWNEADGTSNCFNQTLDGLLTPSSRKPRSTWWANQAYASLSGDRLSLQGAPAVDGLAVMDK